MTGIISYGVAIPPFRITIEEIARAWNKNPKTIIELLDVVSKSVADVDEDTITLATDAAYNTIAGTSISPKKIGAIYIGSESHPYVVKPSGATVAQALGISPYCHTVDLQFACKAGTSAIILANAIVKSKQTLYALGIGADTAQSAPGDVLEYTSAAGAAAFLIGNDAKETIASIDAVASYTTDTPDFWRSQSQSYPMHTGRFTGEPGYFHHIISATTTLLKKIKRKIADFQHVIFHMPNGTFPKRIAKKLGVTFNQLKTGFIVKTVGNTYAASSLLGLARVLQYAKPGERILLTSYGSGAGADSIALTVTKYITSFTPLHLFPETTPTENFISYTEYVNMRGKLKV